MGFHPDQIFHPTATGPALELVKKHQGENVPKDAITFFSGWFCPFVQRVWLSLELKGIPYRYEEINPYRKDTSFLAINPKGLVPAFAIDGKPLYESLIMLEYLEDAYPTSRPLLPTNPLSKAHTRLWIDHASKRLIPTFFRLIQTQSPAARTAERAALVQALEALTGASPGRVGREGGSRFWEEGRDGREEMGMLDVVVAPWFTRLYIVEDHRGGPLLATEFSSPESYARWRAWFDAVMAHPTVIATGSERAHYDQIYDRYLNNTAQSEAAKATRSGQALP